MIKEDYAVKSDSELLSKMADDDAYAFKVLYDRYKRPLYTHAYRKVSDVQLAEDILQDLFAKIWQNRERLRDIGNFSGYIYRTLKNQIIDFYIHQQHVNKYNLELVKGLSYKEDTDHKVRESIFLEQLFAIIHDQIPLGKEIFTLRILEDMKSEEVAEKLGLSEKTIRNRLSLILRLLRDRINTGTVLMLLFSVYLKEITDLIIKR